MLKQITYIAADQADFSNFKAEFGSCPPVLGPAVLGSTYGLISYILPCVLATGCTLAL